MPTCSSCGVWIGILETTGFCGGCRRVKEDRDWAVVNRLMNDILLRGAPLPPRESDPPETLDDPEFYRFAVQAARE